MKPTSRTRKLTPADIVAQEERDRKRKQEREQHLGMKEPEGFEDRMADNQMLGKPLTADDLRYEIASLEDQMSDLDNELKERRAQLAELSQRRD
jgi:hypothetical protein